MGRRWLLDIRGVTLPSAFKLWALNSHTHGRRPVYTDTVTFQMQFAFGMSHCSAPGSLCSALEAQRARGSDDARGWVGTSRGGTRKKASRQVGGISMTCVSRRRGGFGEGPGGRGALGRARGGLLRQPAGRLPRYTRERGAQRPRSAQKSARHLALGAWVSS